MFQKIINFTKLRHVFAVALTLFVVIIGISFVAVPNLFHYIFSSKTEITSVDNKVIIDTDIDTLDDNLKINSIKEDNGSYHVTYSHDTLGISDGFWKKVNIKKTIDVDKSLFKDQKLGKYVAGKLLSDVNEELSNLKSIQIVEQAKGYTQKVVTTTYSGVVGQFVGPTQQVIVNTDSSSSGGSSNVSTSTPSTNLETLAEIIDQMLLESQQNQIIPPTTPLQPPASPTPTTPEPPSPNPNDLIPTPTPLPPQASPSPNPNPSSGSGYFKSDPDIVNTGPLPE